MINYDAGVTVRGDRFSSVLQLEEADKSNNGNYTCSPSNAIAASINVHVLNATAGEEGFICLYGMTEAVLCIREQSTHILVSRW